MPRFLICYLIYWLKIISWRKVPFLKIFAGTVTKISFAKNCLFVFH